MRQPTARVDVTIQEGLTAFGDMGLIRIVVENLIGNAWKFTSKKWAAQIEFGAVHQNDKDVYVVRDNGAGFDMKYASKLFQAFQRLHANEEFEGTGLGLATAKRILDRHGGQIWSESEPGKGTIFYFTLSGPK